VDGKKVKGNGLGLFIVKSIVKRHGGTIRADSKGEGRGSTFIVQLPQAR
jgi:signal transduction histidine kinase